MFTIEQAGSIKKVNTIDELIIEYIRTYACKCNSNGGNLNEEQLKSYLNNALKGVATEEYVNQVIKNIDLSEYATLANLDEYYTKGAADEKYVNKDELANELQNCALKSELNNCLTKDDVYGDSSKIDGIANLINSPAEYPPNTAREMIHHNLTKNSEFLTKAREIGLYIAFEAGEPYTNGYYTLDFADERREQYMFSGTPTNAYYTGIKILYASDSDTFDGVIINTNSYPQPYVITEFYILDTSTIPTIKYINETCALKSDIPTDCVSNDTLTNYRTKDDLTVGENDTIVLKSEVSTAIELTKHITKETFKGYVPCEIITKHFVFEGDFVDFDTACVEFCEGAHLVGEAIFNTHNFSFDVIFQTKRYWNEFEPEYKLHGMSLDDSWDDVLIWDELSGCMYYTYVRINLTLAEKPDYVKPLLKTDIITTSNETATDDKTMSAKLIDQKLNDYAKLTTLDSYYTKNADDEKFVNKDDLANELQNCALKSEIPTDFVSNDTLTTTLNDYAKVATLDEYRKKEDLSVNTFIDLPIEHKIPTDRDYDFNGETAFVEFHEGAQLEGYALVYNSEINDYEHRDFNITFHTDWFGDDWHRYYINTISEITCFWWDNETNVFHGTGADRRVDIAVHLNSAKIVAEDELALKSDLDEYAKAQDLQSYQLKSNTTITHYTPIEQDLNNIDDFVIGAPVYLTGKVYKYVNKQFVLSTETDTTDCICSVKTTGTWKEFVGICTSIDVENKCITFASGGDYMLKVDDTSCYNIGDEVFIDDDNKLKILTGATAITSKIRRTTIGIITSIISKKILAVFKA